MNWEDTVLNKKQIARALKDTKLGYTQTILESQAKPSFEAGKAEGIRTVVDDFATVLDAPERARLEMFYDVFNMWQAFLKEQGVE